jgi:hypothetical protein
MQVGYGGRGMSAYLFHYVGQTYLKPLEAR